MNSSENNNRFKWVASGNAPLLFPTELVTGIFLFEDLTKVDIPQSSPFATVWGKPVSIHLSNNTLHPIPKYILIAWFSIVESKFYAVSEELPQKQIEALCAEKDEKTKEAKYNTLIAGMAPYGKLSIWVSGNDITREVAWLQGKEVSVEMKNFVPNSNLNKEEYAKKMLANCPEAFTNLQQNGLPDPMRFERYMQKFNYRIMPQFETVETILNGIEIYYYNGELDATNSGKHISNIMRAKPCKMVLNWSEGKKQYSGYFWTDETKIIETFMNVYGNDVEKEGNLTLEVKESNKQFRFLLQTDNVLKEIPMDELQYIIFKNKFEFHRSKNYNKQSWLF